jgi:triosephosphate isomerase
MNLIVAANWKMHKTAAETGSFCRRLKEAEARLHGVDVLICPPFTALYAARAALEGSSIKLGAQNVFWEKKGAFTGEISPMMLVDLGVGFVIIGHSERRHLMGETDAAVARKLRAVLEHGLTPVLCVGETEAERLQGRTEEILERQLRTALEGLEPGAAAGLVVAYEPVWAIGTGKAASPDDAAKAAALIRGVVARCQGNDTAQRLRIQYGGSVNAGNIGAFVALPAVHGALVGGASLEPGSFIDLILAAREAAGS